MLRNHANDWFICCRNVLWLVVYSKFNFINLHTKTQPRTKAEVRDRLKFTPLVPVETLNYT